MALFHDWFDRNVWPVKRSYPEGVATVNGSLLQSILLGDGVTDEHVSIRKGLRCSTTYTCVNVRGKTIGSLPWGVFQDQGRNKVALTDLPLYWAIGHEPNKYMTSAAFWMLMEVWCCGWGEAFAMINRDSRYRTVSFDPLEPWEIDVRYSKGDLWYSYQGGDLIPSRDILHFRAFSSLDGIRSCSPIMENQDVYGMAIKLKRYSSLIMGAQPPGILKYEGNLSPTQIAENQKNWNKRSKGDVAVMGGNWSYESIMTPGDEVQYNVTKEINEREQCAIYSMPPTFVQNFQRQTYSNAEQSDLSYAKHTVMPAATMYEKELNMKCLPESMKATTFTKMNLNGLLRGDINARKEFYQAMVNTGVMSRNEARSYEDLNPYKGGDEYLIQGAMKLADADLLRKEQESKTVPSAEPKTTERKNYVNGHTVN